MQPIRFGILGFGYHAAFRLVPSFRNCQHATLVGFHRRDPAKAARDAATHNIRAFESAEALCASPDIDAIFITSPDALHLPDAQLAFAHKKPVLCEKPLAATAEQAETMLAAAKVAGVLFGVAHHYRWAHAIQQVRDRVAAGEIGDPLTAHAEFNYAAQFSRRPWINDPTLAAGGPIGDVGVHCIDTLRFILDNTKAKTVSTIATQDAHSGAVEASASMQFAFANNLLASVNVSARAQYRTQIEIDHPVDVVLRRKGSHVNTNTVNNADAYTRMIDNFAQALRGSEPFLGPGTEGVHNQHILDAAFKSWHSGKREPVAGA
jgi:predicted dehydrogenase